VAYGARFRDQGFTAKVLEVANRFLHEPIRMDGANYLLPEASGLGADLDLAALPFSR